MLPARASQPVRRHHCALAAMPAGPTGNGRNLGDAGRSRQAHNVQLRARLRTEHPPYNARATRPVARGSVQRGLSDAMNVARLCQPWAWRQINALR